MSRVRLVRARVSVYTGNGANCNGERLARVFPCDLYSFTLTHTRTRAHM